VKRNAFSLLEIIIATAVLAASAMVLSSLIGTGSKFGNRAEERTIALTQAESLLDEFVAGLGNSDKGDNRLEEVTGELPGPPPRGFRISATPFDIGSVNAIGAGPNGAGPNEGGSSSNVRSAGLLRVTAEVFETAGTNVTNEAKSLIELSRLIRQPQRAPDSVSNGMSLNAARGVDPSIQGAFP